MPTVLRVSGYVFHFYSNENQEPPHIHVRAAEKAAKFWLTPIVAPAKCEGFNARELLRVQRLVEQYRDLFLESWHDVFDAQQAER